MTYQKLVTEIQRLSVSEQLALLEVLTRSLRNELQPRAGSISSAKRVRGMLKPDGPLPSDDELKNDYTNYLIQKYT